MLAAVFKEQKGGIMGGYGASSGRKKDKCYKDTYGRSVSGNNPAIPVAEHYLEQGKYVAFLGERGKNGEKGEKRADLSVEGIHVEVKGIETTVNPSTIADHIEKGFNQVYADNHRYDPETHREGKVIFYSRHSAKYSSQEIEHSVRKGFAEALRKGDVKGKVELWLRGQIIKLN